MFVHRGSLSTHQSESRQCEQQIKVGRRGAMSAVALQGVGRRGRGGGEVLSTVSSLRSGSLK